MGGAGLACPPRFLAETCVLASAPGTGVLPLSRRYPHYENRTYDGETHFPIPFQDAGFVFPTTCYLTCLCIHWYRGGGGYCPRVVAVALGTGVLPLSRRYPHNEKQNLRWGNTFPHTPLRRGICFPLHLLFSLLMYSLVSWRRRVLPPRPEIEQVEYLPA